MTYIPMAAAANSFEVLYTVSKFSQKAANLEYSPGVVSAVLAAMDSVIMRASCFIRKKAPTICSWVQLFVHLQKLGLCSATCTEIVS